jgi:hypothetical protein
MTTSTPTTPSSPGAEYDFSVVRGGPLRALRAKLGLGVEGGPALLRRCAALIAITWLPVTVGAIAEGLAFEGSAASDPLLRHFGVHARFLLSLPLLLIAEARMDRVFPALTRHFAASGLIGEQDLPAYRRLLQNAAHFRDSRWGALFVALSFAAVLLFAASPGHAGHDLSWASPHQPHGFAAAWYSFVSRPLFAGLLALWCWRLATGIRLLALLSRFPLRLAPSHPDRTGGLGFLEGIAPACVPLVLAVSVVLAGRWGHDVLYHGIHVDSLKPQVATFVAAMLLLFAGPLLLMAGPLRRFKRRALLQYGLLAGEQSRLVHEKWIAGRPVGDPPILSAPEIGPVADMAAIFDAVAGLRPAPIGLRLLLPIALAALLPILPVFAIEIPIRKLLQTLAGALL